MALINKMYINLCVVLVCFSTLVVLSSAQFDFSIPLSLIRKESCPFSSTTCVEGAGTTCVNAKYRTIDGRCNNPTKLTMGVAYTTYGRLLPPAYADKIYKIRTANDGSDLPSTRLLSTKLFGRQRISDTTWTWMNMQFGQFAAHDLSNRASNNLRGLKAMSASRQKCCTKFGKYLWETTSTRCETIPVPSNDPTWKKRECIHFDRTITDRDQQCRGAGGNKPAEQINAVSHYFDLNIVYGNTDATAKRVREFRNGLLRTNKGRGKFPPRTRPEDTKTYCPSSLNETCFHLGDPRGNQSPGLVTIHVLFLREHNRLARELQKINPQWNDDTLFEEARRINIAQYQRINYYEWGVEIYGKDRLKAHKLIYPDVKGGEYINDYNSCIDPRALQEFAHSAFRYFHHQIIGVNRMYNEARQPYGPFLRLTETLDRPSILVKGCEFDSAVRGMGTQPQKRTDTNFDNEMSENFPFGEADRGRDLKAYDIQRCRDHGLPSYNAYREYCGIKRATQFSDFSDYIEQKDIDALRSVYKHPEDVDLSVGGSLEKHPTKALLGPTFLCLNLIQYYRSRAGDRYFFENGDQLNPFTKPQLAEIRKATISRIMCDNSDVKSMQPNGFRLIKEDNPLKPCDQLPRIDLTKWKTNARCR